MGGWVGYGCKWVGMVGGAAGRTSGVIGRTYGVVWAWQGGGLGIGAGMRVVVGVHGWLPSYST